MDKQKQIEEMEKIMCSGCIENELMTCSFTHEEVPCDFAKNFAEALYNTGYRKIPENAVVLTREEKAKLLHEMYEQGKFDGVVKFAERLKAKQAPLDEYDEISIGSLFADIDEICKEITEGKV